MFLPPPFVIFVTYDLLRVCRKKNAVLALAKSIDINVFSIIQLLYSFPSANFFDTEYRSYSRNALDRENS